MQGTQWSEEETWIIHDKLQTLMLSSDNVVDEYQKLHPKGPKYKKLMQPNPPKVKKGMLIMDTKLHWFCFLYSF